MDVNWNPLVDFATTAVSAMTSTIVSIVLKPKQTTSTTSIRSVCPARQSIRKQANHVCIYLIGNKHETYSGDLFNTHFN